MRPIHQLYKIGFCWLFLWPFLLHAQSFRYNQYTTYNGLPIDNIYAAAQDGNGFMWFATNFGISKFDGHDFYNYGKKNGINNMAVMDIVYAGGDSLVFISYPNTIQSIHYDGKINTLINEPNYSFHQLARHQNDIYGYHRNDQNYLFLHTGKWKTCNADSSLGGKDIKIHTIFSLRERGVAFCTTQGLYIMQEGLVTHLLPGQNVQIGILTTKNNILVVSNNFITEIDPQLRVTKTSLQMPTGFLPYQVEEEHGNIWFRNIEKGVIRLQNNVLDEMSAALNLTGKTINKFFTDRDGNFWINTDGNGVLLQKNTHFGIYDIQDGLPNNKVLDLLQQGDKLYIGTENGMAEKKGDAIETFKLPSAKEGLKYVHQIQQVNEKKIGITISHVFQFDETGAGYFLKNFSSTLKAYNGMFAWQENEDNLWTYKIFYPQYLYKITNDRFISDSVDISSYAIKKVYKMIGYNGSYWAGTDKGIIRFQKDKSSFIKNLNGEPFGQVFDFLVDKKNRLWMATETGLFICENDQITPVPKNGTQGGNYCTAITMDDKERIWAATWDGIFVTDGVKKTYFNTIDGLPSKTINCILFDNSAHKIYAGTDNGLAVLNKDAFEVVRPSYRSFSVCKLASDSSLVKYIPDGISLPPSQNDLIFHLSVPYYQDYENIKYEYRLDKNAWTSTASPEITLNDIGSGKHLFYSRVRVNGSIITSEDAVFSFSIQTRFYENWWFWLIVALLLQFILFRVINQYNKKAREKKLAVKMQEADYASLKQQAFTSLMNPHFIFNALNSVQHYINQQDRQSANKYLSDFATLIRRGFDSAQKSFVTLEEELETIRLYLQLEKMRFAGKFDYTINLSKEAEAEDWMLPSMVLQPFLENAILHGLMPLSEKGHLIIDVATQHNSLYITIADNGVGIEKSKALHSGNRHKSRGMQLIKERLELLSKLGKEPISLSIGELYPGAANPGTRIRLIIPQELYETIHKQRTQS